MRVISSSPRRAALLLLIDNIYECIADTFRGQSVKHLFPSIKACFHQYPLDVAKFKRFRAFAWSTVLIHGEAQTADRER